MRIFFEAMGTESIDITTQIAYKFVLRFGGEQTAFDPDWFYRWLAAVFAAAPSAAVQVCEGLASRIAHSDRLFHKWEGHRLVQVWKEPPNTAFIRI